MPGEDKTEKATPKRRRDERKKGNVLMCQDIIAVATLVGSVAMLWLMFPSFVTNLTEFFHRSLSFVPGVAEVSVVDNLSQLLFQGIEAFVFTVGPMLGVTALVAVAATFAQTRFLVAGEIIKPKFSKLSPLNGFKRLFSLRSIIEALKGIIKITILLVLIYNCLQDVMQSAANFMYADLGAACRSLFSAIFNMLLQVCLAFVAIAFFDFLYQRWEHERKMKMSKQEIKEEYKQTEGDAVALRYRQGKDAAPVVLAKGQDELAARIVAKGEEHKVPVVENVPLARALYAQAELNQEIPPELYSAVAEVLVYIFRLEKKL